MKKIMVTTSAFLLSFSLATGAWAAGEYGSDKSQKSETQMQSESQMGTEQQSGMQTAQASQVKSTNELIGKSVQSDQGEEIGNISDLLVDAESGQVGYALVSSGGVLGMGEDNYIVPWKAVQSDPQTDALKLSISQDQLQQAPKGQQVADRQQAREIHQFYGVSPYWEEGGQQQQQDFQLQQEQQKQEPGMEQEYEIEVPEEGQQMSE